jgi:hypothetical protein
VAVDDLPMRATLAQLWGRGELPIRDALYLADGRAFAVALDARAPGGLTVCEPFDLDALLAQDPEWVTSLAVSKQVELRPEDGGGFVCCGEGSWGSEGAFARLRPDGAPMWVVYLERSNPFTVVDIDVQSRVARFRSSSGVRVSVALSADGEFLPAAWPGAS